MDPQTSKPIIVKLDRDRAIRWTNRAMARNSSLPRPFSFKHLSRPKNQLYALCAVIWCALVDNDHDFDAPEDLAEYLQTAEQQTAALRAIVAAVNEAYPEPKSS